MQMSRSGSAALATAACLTLGAVLPAAAGAAPSDAGSAERPLGPVEQMSADYLASTYGLSAAEARTRVLDQDTHARTEQALAQQLGEDFVGSYIDQKRGVLVVSVTDPTMAAGAKRAKTEVKVVSHSRSDLDRQQASAERLLGATALSSHVDLERNAVVVTVAQDQVAAARKAVAGLKGVQVDGTAARPRAHASVYGGQQIEFSGYVCSLGFNATKNGANVFVTAGHCGAGYQSFTRNGTFLGKTAAYAFPGNDMAYATLSSSWTGAAAVDKWNGQGVAVKGSTEAPVGAAVCKSGRTTGWTCGTIRAKNTTVNYSREDGGTDTVRGLVSTNTCTEGGDSGGSWLAGNQGQGVTSGGLGYGAKQVCGSKVGQPNVAYYQPLNPILSTYGLTLKTYAG